MKNTFIYSLLLMVISGTSLSLAQTTTSGTITTEVVSLLTAEETAVLSFGKVSPDAGGGSVQLTPQGERVASGNILLVNSDYSIGKFTLRGAQNSLVSILLPDAPRPLYNASGKQEIQVGEWMTNVPEGGLIMETENGQSEINIGATLTIGNWSSSPRGFYSGTYQVIFMYN